MFRKLPNIILILCDTLGAKHMSLYGYERDTTPNLERLVEKDGWAVYTRCFAPAPWTIPSHASLFTGLYPSEHGIDGTKDKIGENVTTLTKILKEIGYNTIGISNNLLIHSQFVKGWNKFYEMDKLFQNDMVMAELGKYFHFMRISRKEKLFKIIDSLKRDFIPTCKFIVNRLYNRKFNVFKNATPFTLRTLREFNNLINFLNTSPFFLFVNLMQTHDRYYPPSSIRGKFSKELCIENEMRYYNIYDYYLGKWNNRYLNCLCSLYDEEVLFLDRIIKLMLDNTKKKLDNLSNTIFIITSDHGELFSEHNQVNHFFTTYNELLHIPLLIKWPKDFNIKNEITDLVQLHDLFSTILDIIGAPFPAPLSSKSLLSSQKRKFAISQLLDINFKIEGLKNRNPDFIPKDFMQPMMSVITEDFWKITKRLDGYIEVYNLCNDLYETEDLSKSNFCNDKVTKLKEVINLLEKATGFYKAAIRPIK